MSLMINYSPIVMLASLEGAELSTGESAVGVIVWIVATIGCWILYHKIFDVYYFNVGQGCLKEIFISAVIGLIIASIVTKFLGGILGALGGLLGFLIKAALIIGAIYLVYKLCTKNSVPTPPADVFKTDGFDWDSKTNEEQKQIKGDFVNNWKNYYEKVDARNSALTSKEQIKEKLMMPEDFKCQECSKKLEFSEDEFQAVAKAFGHSMRIYMEKEEIFDPLPQAPGHVFGIEGEAWAAKSPEEQQKIKKDHINAWKKYYREVNKRNEALSPEELNNKLLKPLSYELIQHDLRDKFTTEESKAVAMSYENSMAIYNRLAPQKES